MLAVFRNLLSGLTHHGTGPVLVMFASGYLDIGSWWKWGLIVSVSNVVIWLVLGGLR